MTKIEKLAKQRNFTITKLAHDVGVSRPTVYSWYNGKEPSINDVLELARVFKVDPSVIFSDYIK